MCGVVGTFDRRGGPPPTYQDVTAMLAMLRHRGPDAAGVYLDSRIGLGAARLSIVNLAGGPRPLTNEDQSLWLVCNGAIFE